MNIEDLPLLGQGSEWEVYALDEQRVLRISRSERSLLRWRRALGELYDAAAPNLPYLLPEVLETGSVDGRAFAVERRIPGRPMSEVLPSLDGASRRRLLGAYLDAAARFGDVRLDDRPYGELLREPPLVAETWHGFLTAAVRRSLDEHGPRLGADTGLDRSALSGLVELHELPERPPKALVHGDFYPANVMVADDLRITGVLDLSPMTLVGDPQVDVAGCLMWLEVVPGHRESDTAFLRKRVLDDHPGIGPALYEWCVGNLRASRAPE